MIGRVRFPVTAATLGDDGRWRSRDAELARHLNSAFSPADDGPWAGVWGVARVRAAARRLGGVAEFPPPSAAADRPAPGDVY